MKERPILFSSPMVCALLAGTKTQTRRVVNPQPAEHYWSTLPNYMHQVPFHVVEGGGAVRSIHSHQVPGRERAFDLGEWIRCPYGAPGDQLWVRETWGLCIHSTSTAWCRDSIKGRSPDELAMAYALAYSADGDSPHAFWRPSIHMPRWASRLTLEVAGVRVERLHAITDDDAKAEGVQPFTDVSPDQVIPGPGFDGARLGDQPHRLPYADLWRAINGAESWDANPWVWVISVKRVTHE